MTGQVTKSHLSLNPNLNPNLQSYKILNLGTDGLRLLGIKDDVISPLELKSKLHLHDILTAVDYTRIYTHTDLSSALYRSTTATPPPFPLFSLRSLKNFFHSSTKDDEKETKTRREV